MEGLSGIRIYQKYSITEQYLPKIYKDKIEFLIMGISHTINTKEWNTTIDGLSIPKISKDLISSNQESLTQQTSNNKVQQSDDNVNTPNADALRLVLDKLGYKEKEEGREYKGGPIVEGPQLSNGGDITLKLKNYAESVFRKIKESYPGIQITVTGGNDSFHQNLNSASSHKSGNGLDFIISPNNQENRNKVEKILFGYVINNPGIWFINEYDYPSSNSSGGHFHIRIGQDKSGADRIAEAKKNKLDFGSYSLT
jgi:preprotein translocase subunit SecD